ncbi:hypothetical protein glysoja_037656 [Glycine soja]|uniref:Uncharacterized protein n=2 Tax=Glycine soja TaxID=3848 RepID=A0A0B2QUZ9_GLYSO|nr:hypothetical protein glysoja_037656 [Glycine soja]
MEKLRPAWAVKAIIVIVFTSILFRCVCGENHTVGGASGWDLRSNIQAWSSTTTFNIGDDLDLRSKTFRLFLSRTPILIHTGARRGGSEPTRLQHVYDSERACHIRQRRNRDPPERRENALLCMRPNAPLPTGP